MKKPDICTSLSCTAPKKHCCECSHAYYEKTLIVNGKKNFMEFNPMFGPLFLNENGEPRKRQPTERNPVWREFEKWYQGIRKL